MMNEVTAYKILIEDEKMMVPANSDFFFKSVFFKSVLITLESTTSMIL